MEDRSKRMKENAMLLLRGFDSVSCSLSHLPDNLENALQANSTRTNHIIWTMGTDFKYQYSHTWVRNIDKLIHYVNQDGRVNALYSSPSIYTDAKYAMDKYADRINAYWTGYFTSRPALKLYVRMMSGYYLAARQLEFCKGRSETGGPTTEVLADALAISQHNDAVSGTSKQYVANDYTKRLFIGYKQADDIVSSSLTCMVEPVSASGCKLAETFIYLALEYAVTGKITIKADVFSFGVVLMELLSGWMALDEDRPNESQYLVAWNIKSSKEILIATIDPALDVKQESTLDSIYTVAKLIGHCTTREPGQRPDMSHVVNMFATTSVVLITVFHSTKWSKAGKNRKEKT
ncbi:Alpha-mannosidase [Capsicum baccatum]|uniref:Alpha-mannosidase n=1 Tax=Capsicum baccatum TaxID=33114 RepID=A0A2G2WAQ2_CAPBA|nr:Alpha-mannosidase [Capsicum baccatum]